MDMYPDDKNMYNVLSVKLNHMHVKSPVNSS